MRASLLFLLCAVFVLAAPTVSEAKKDISTADPVHVSGEIQVTRGLTDYISNVDPTGAMYPWIDATAGTNVPIGDDELVPVALPFDFSVYDDDYSAGASIEVNSNGSVHFDFGGPRTLWVNCGDIPSTIDGQWVAALGDDLDPTSGGTVWWIVTGTAPNRVLTFEWVDVPEFGGTGAVDLQVNLFETTNMIVTQYREGIPPEFLGDGVVGLNAGDGVRGQELYCASSGGLPSTEFDVSWTRGGATPVEPSTWGDIKAIYR